MEKGYKIPIVDISNQTNRQTIVDKEDALYLGHPTTVLLEDGKTILIVYPKNHGNGQIVYKKSLDAGLTWSDRLPVPDSFSTSLEVPTLYRTVDKDGGKRLIMFSGLYPIRMSVSKDDGNTFSELEPIGDYGGIVAMGDIECIGNGEYIALFHDDGRYIHGGKSHKIEVFSTGEGNEKRTKVLHSYSTDEGITWSTPEDNWIKTLEKSDDKWVKIYEAYGGNLNKDGKFYLYQVNSKDGGLTWSEPKVICTHNTAKLCEPAIIKSPDGKKLVVLLREEARKHNSHMIISEDNADTWCEPIELPASLTGDRHCARYLKDGRLFISFRDTTRESATKGDWVAWVGTFDDIINLKDGMYRVRIMKNYKNDDCAYPGIEVLSDGTVVTTTYGHWIEGEQAFIMSVRVHPEELDKIYEKLIK